MNKIRALDFVLLCSFSDSRSLFVFVLSSWHEDRLCFFKLRQACTNHSGVARYTEVEQLQISDRLYHSVLSNTPGDAVPVWKLTKKIWCEKLHFQNPSFFVQKIKILVRIPFLIFFYVSRLWIK
jgi:hypothetical protein